MLTRSRDIKFGTVELLPSRTAPQLGSSLMKVVKLYALRGFVVNMIMLDMEFESVKDHVLVEVNTTAAREHVGEIERYVRTVKERCRATISDLPFQFYHRLVIVRLVYFAVMMTNVPVADGGISREFSPREIVTGKRFDVQTQCRTIFGEYIEASEDADITNDMSPRTEPCIWTGSWIQGHSRAKDSGTTHERCGRSERTDNGSRPPGERDTGK